MVKTALVVWFLVFGTVTLKEGGSALYGALSGTAIGAYWPPVIALNTFTGLLYISAALALILRPGLTRPLAWVILGVASATTLLFFGHVISGGGFERRTVVAILIRLVVALAALAFVRRLIPGSHWAKSSGPEKLS
jgi:hypothetical protein